MVKKEFQGDVAVFGFDVVNFTKDRNQQNMLRIRRRTGRILGDAIKAANVSSEGKRAWSDAGDGGYLCISGDPRQVLSVLEHFVGQLESDNETMMHEHRVALRYALHYDSISISGEGEERQIVGNAINVCARLLSQMNREYRGQVVASAAFVKKVQEFGPVGALFEQLIPFVDKHEKRHEVYNVRRDPGFGIKVPTEDLLVPPP